MSARMTLVTLAVFLVSLTGCIASGSLAVSYDSVITDDDDTVTTDDDDDFTPTDDDDTVVTDDDDTVVTDDDDTVVTDDDDTVDQLGQVDDPCESDEDCIDFDPRWGTPGNGEFHRVFCGTDEVITDITGEEFFNGIYKSWTCQTVGWYVECLPDFTNQWGDFYPEVGCDEGWTCIFNLDEQGQPMSAEQDYCVKSLE